MPGNRPSKRRRFACGVGSGKTANTLAATDDEKALMKLFQLLTAKPVLFACNVAESDLATAEQNPFVQKVAEYVRTHHDAAYVPISAKIFSCRARYSSMETGGTRGVESRIASPPIV